MAVTRRLRRYKWGSESPAIRARELDAQVIARVNEFAERLADSVRQAALGIGLDVGGVVDHRGALEPIVAVCYERAETLAHERLEHKLRLAEALDGIAKVGELMGFDVRTIDVKDDRTRGLIEAMIAAIKAGRGRGPAAVYGADQPAIERAGSDGAGADIRGVTPPVSELKSDAVAAAAAAGTGPGEGAADGLARRETGRGTGAPPAATGVPAEQPSGAGIEGDGRQKLRAPARPADGRERGDGGTKGADQDGDRAGGEDWTDPAVEGPFVCLVKDHALSGPERNPNHIDGSKHPMRRPIIYTRWTYVEHYEWQARRIARNGYQLPGGWKLPEGTELDGDGHVIRRA